MHRAFWAIPRTLKTKAGQPVNVVFGVASMLLSILKQEEPDGWVWCCDRGDETFRHQEHAEYKAGRQETPQEFYDQIPTVETLLETMGIAVAGSPQFEADDYLGTYAEAAVKSGTKRVTIVTGDRDALQLASTFVRIAIPHKGYQATEYLGPDEVLAKYGVRPDQVPALKGLAGDSSDNLQGVHGIGPKTAAELLQTYNTLENLYEHLDQVKPATRAKLEADRDSAFFCQKMALLVRDAPLPVPLERAALAHQPIEPIVTLFEALEFSLLRRRLESLLQSPFGQRAFTGEIRTPEHQVRSRAATVSPTETQPSLF